jgi:hypothetical protein
MHSTFKNSNYLFILANPGAGGHRLGRIISCINNVYWYSHDRNGINPWDVFFTDKVSGKSISQYHYDRLVGKQSIPLLGERIERWWYPEDVDYFYSNIWAKEIEEFQPMLETKYIHWVLHDSPTHILARFPNAKIIALVDTDIDAVVDRYLETTAKFPCYYHHKNLKPNYMNDYAVSVELVQQKEKTATERDLWIFNNYYSVNDYDTDYRNFLYRKITEENDIRNQLSDPRYIKITWKTFNIDQVIEFLEATGVDPNYKKLLN